MLHQRLCSFWYNRIFKNLKILKVIFKANRFDVIIIQKVTIWPFLLSILKLRNANLVFDFDDLCTWPPELIERKIGIRARWRLWREDLQHPRALSKFTRIIAGNNYLKDLVLPFVSKDKVTVIPTSLDCNLYFPDTKVKNKTSTVIGWSGTGENHLKHLKLLTGPFEVLAKKYKILFRLVGAMYSENIKRLFRHLGSSFICIDWVAPEKLPDEIRKFDIGVMPLESDEDTKGKCGFKVLEYMACGLPVVVSPVGVNRDIVQDGINGFWAGNESEWIRKISILIEDSRLRTEFGQKGRKTVEDKYSLNKSFSSFLDVVEGLAHDRKKE